MIHGINANIRQAEADDAPFLYACYRAPGPLAGVLDARREPIEPTVEELSETLARSNAQDAAFYLAEDKAGVPQVCAIFRRAKMLDGRFGELSFLYEKEFPLTGPCAAELLEFLVERAFVQMELSKILTQCVDSETALCAFLSAHGFASQGVTREAVYAGGKWHGVETFARFAPSRS